MQTIAVVWKFSFKQKFRQIPNQMLFRMTELRYTSPYIVL